MEETQTQISVSQALKDMNHRNVTVFGRQADLIRAFEFINKTQEKITAIVASKEIENKARQMAISQSYVIVG